MVRQPQTCYAKGPEGNLAYQVVGDGQTDLVNVPGWFSHVDLLWGDPGWASFVGELASFARVILYDKLGTGLSDPVDGVPTLESRTDDLRPVLDAAGSDPLEAVAASAKTPAPPPPPPPRQDTPPVPSCGDSIRPASPTSAYADVPARLPRVTTNKRNWHSLPLLKNRTLADEHRLGIRTPRSTCLKGINTASSAPEFVESSCR
jgi:hypothetical protein